MNITKTCKTASAFVLSMALLAACGSNDSTSSSPQTATLAASSVRAGAAISDNSVVSINGYRANYTMTRSDDGVVTAKNNLTGEVAKYPNALLLKFFDKYTSFDIEGTPGQVYRLYQAAFNRKPDLPGLGFWIKRNESGEDLLSIANSFILSDEFKRMYGDQVEAGKFITLLYNNVLHRDPEKDGYDWWVAQVNAGAVRNGVLFGFSNSDENRKNLLPDMRNGFDYVPFQPGGVIRPMRSSYENKAAAGLALGAQDLPPEVASSATVAFGDFFQDGSYSMVTHTLDYIPEWSITKFGQVKFYRRDEAGKWVDRTDALLADKRGCLHPRKAVVADFNSDGKPDIFLACHGYDRPPYPGEQPHILFSQADGTYKNVTLPFACFCHSASAVDLKGDGYADVIVTDNSVIGTPFILRNQKNGTFSMDLSSLPTSFKNKAIFSVELVDFDGGGRYDLWVGGNEPGATENAPPSDADVIPQIVRNDGANKFIGTEIVKLAAIPDYGLPLDMVFNGGKIYMLRTNIGGGPTNYGKSFYTLAAVQVVDYASLSSSLPYTHEGSYKNGMPWVNWIIPSASGVVAMDTAYDLSVSKK